MRPLSVMLLIVAFAGCIYDKQTYQERWDALADDDNDFYVLEDDCNDNDANIHPNAGDIPGNGIDEDCNGFDDCYVDGDFDGYGKDEVITGNSLDCDSRPGFSTTSDDCNDNDDEINRDGNEIPGNGVDEDCNGVDACYIDSDGDGYGSFSQADGDGLDCDNSANLSSNHDDCNDNAFDVNPGASELTGDSVDQNCNGNNDT